MNHGSNYNDGANIDTCSSSTNIKVPTEQLNKLKVLLCRVIWYL